MTIKAMANITMTIPRWTITKKRMSKMKAFEWTDECQRAFEELKAYLSSPPLFNSSKPNEELSLYLVISPTVVSLALIQQVPTLQQDLMAKHYERKPTGT